MRKQNPFFSILVGNEDVREPPVTEREPPVTEREPPVTEHETPFTKRERVLNPREAALTPREPPARRRRKHVTSPEHGRRARSIDRTAHRDARFVENVGINHRRAHVLVPEELLPAQRLLD